MNIKKDFLKENAALVVAVIFSIAFAFAVFSPGSIPPNKLAQKEVDGCVTGGASVMIMLPKEAARLEENEQFVLLEIKFSEWWRKHPTAQVNQKLYLRGAPYASYITFTE